jgi:DNA polymerase-3 subunit gamma/tau
MSPYVSLYRKYRPKTFSEIVGQEHVVSVLRSAVASGRTPHAYLFSGPRGTGKTTSARILAKALNCESLKAGEPCNECASCREIQSGASWAVTELDAASNNGVDAIRDLTAKAHLASPGRNKVYIVDEVHMLSTAASNALLKTLEEPPFNVVFILATTDPQKVLPTVRSRCQHLEFRLLKDDELAALVRHVAESEGIAISEEMVAEVVARGRGSARDALTALEYALVAGRAQTLPDVARLAEAVAGLEYGGVLLAIGELVSAGVDPVQVASDLAELFRQAFLTTQAPLMVSPTTKQVVGEERLRSLAEALKTKRVVQALEAVGRAVTQMRSSPEPQLTLESSLLSLMAGWEAEERLSQRLAALEDRVSALEAGAASARPPGDSGLGGGATGGSFEAPGSGPGGSQVGGGDPPAASDPPAPRSPSRTIGAVKKQGTRSSVAPGDQPGEVAEDALDRDQVVLAFADEIKDRLPPKVRTLFVRGRFTKVEGDVVHMAFPPNTSLSEVQAFKEVLENEMARHFRRRVRLAIAHDAEPKPQAEDELSQKRALIAEQKARLETVFGPVELVGEEGDSGEGI